MPRINGKEVVFRKRFPAKDHWDLPQRLSTIAEQANRGELNLKEAVPVFQHTIASWEFDGDPNDADAYGELEMFDELIPLLAVTAEYIGELTDRGEAASASI